MAGSFRVEADVEGHGPLFTGEADKLLKEWARNTAKALADEGAEKLRAWNFDKGVRGRDARGRFTHEASGRSRGGFRANINVITDGPVARIPGPMITGVVWAPWLEGTSKRNNSTGFKGYHMFRDTAKGLRERASEVGQDELDKILPRLGGTP